MRWFFIVLLSSSWVYGNQVSFPLKGQCPRLSRLLGLARFPEHFQDSGLMPIGSGGMGEVFLVEFKGTKRKVVRKYFANWRSDDLLFDESSIRHEADVYLFLKEKDVKVVPQFLGQWSDVEGRKFLEFDFISGSQDYSDFLEFDPFLNPKRNLQIALAFFDKILSSVEELNTLGVTHYDLKPANILVTGAGQVKIIDFSSADFPGMDPRAKSQRGLTPGYHPPEARSHPHPSSDQYSLAKILLIDLFPRLKETFKSDPSALAAIEKYQESLNESVIKKATAVDPRERYSGIGEMRKALKSWRTRWFW